MIRKKVHPKKYVHPTSYLTSFRFRKLFRLALTLDDRCFCTPFKKDAPSLHPFDDAVCLHDSQLSRFAQIIQSLGGLADGEPHDSPVEIGFRELGL